MEFFPHTTIEIRAWGKSQIAAKLGMSRITLRKNIRKIEPELIEKFKGYNKNAKKLYPEQLKYILMHMGFM